MDLETFFKQRQLRKNKKINNHNFNENNKDLTQLNQIITHQHIPNNIHQTQDLLSNFLIKKTINQNSLSSNQYFSQRQLQYQQALQTLDQKVQIQNRTSKYAPKQYINTNTSTHSKNYNIDAHQYNSERCPFQYPDKNYNLEPNQPVVVKSKVSQLRKQVALEFSHIHNDINAIHLQTQKRLNKSLIDKKSLKSIQQSLNALDQIKQERFSTARNQRVSIHSRRGQDSERTSSPLRKSIFQMAKQSIPIFEHSLKIVKSNLTKRGEVGTLSVVTPIPSYETTLSFEKTIFTVDNRLHKNLKNDLKIILAKNLRARKIRKSAILHELNQTQDFNLQKPDPEAYKVKELTRVTTNPKTGIWEVSKINWMKLPDEEINKELGGINEYIRENFHNPNFFERVILPAEEQEFDRSFESVISDHELDKILKSKETGKKKIIPKTFHDQDTLSLYLDTKTSSNNKAEKRRRERDLLKDELQKQESQVTYNENMIEYFEFSKKNAKKTNPLIAADDDSPEYGTTNLYGNVQKRRAKTNKFHPRWLVLKGFDLYWFRTSNSTKQKGVIKLPCKPIKSDTVGSYNCFNIEKEEGGGLTLLDNDHGHTFRLKLSNHIYLKMYIQEVTTSGLALDKEIMNYLKDPYVPKIEINKSNYFNGTIIEYVMNTIESHCKLQELSIVECDISDETFSMLEKVLSGVSHTLIKIDLSSNQITKKSSSTFLELLKNPNNSKIMNLVLDNNFIFDNGAQSIAHGLYEKYKYMVQKSQTSFESPINSLSLQNIKMADQGLITFIHTFENIANKNKSSKEDYKNPICFNFSSNLITDHGIKVVSELIKRFNGVSQLDLSNLIKCKGSGFFELAKALKENKSVQVLNLSGNKITNNAFSEILIMLEENYILRTVKISLQSILSGNLYNHSDKLKRLYVIHNPTKKI